MESPVGRTVDDDGPPTDVHHGRPDAVLLHNEGHNVAVALLEAGAGRGGGGHFSVVHPLELVLRGGHGRRTGRERKRGTEAEPSRPRCGAFV